MCVAVHPETNAFFSSLVVFRRRRSICGIACSTRASKSCSAQRWPCCKLLSVPCSLLSLCWFVVCSFAFCNGWCCFRQQNQREAHPEGLRFRGAAHLPQNILAQVATHLTTPQITHTKHQQQCGGFSAVSQDVLRCEVDWQIPNGAHIGAAANAQGEDR